MYEKNIKFLADESCDFTVVRALRALGYDVVSVAESFASASDLKILEMSVEEKRLLLTEDKDFGDWIFAHGEEIKNFTVLEPGRARIRKII